MHEPSRARRFLKWTLAAATVLVLLSAAWASGSEQHLGQAVSFQMEDGVLTVRTWGTAGGVSEGIPSDDPARHPRGIPDSLSIPTWILIAGLVLPTASLWWADRRSKAVAPPAQGDAPADPRMAHRQARA